MVKKKGIDSEFNHWEIKKKESTLWLLCNKKNSTDNTIDKQLVKELQAILIAIKEDPSIQALIICSGKPHCFAMGADIPMLASLSSEKEVFELIRLAQEVFAQLEALPFPTIALIKGLCLGGGLELALACRNRIAINGEADTRLGLPEVKLGLQPGWGGTVRLPRLIGAVQALKLMITGKTISAKAAAKIGLVDVVIPERDVERAVSYYTTVHKQGINFWPPWSNNITAVRNLIAAKFKQHLLEKVNPQHYPAPYQILAHWREYGTSDQAFLAEAESLRKLIMTPTARNLIHVYFLRERLQKLGEKKSKKFKHIHVVGAGTMGGDIAAWCVLQGLHVTLQDRKPKYIAPALGRAYQLFKKQFKKTRFIQAAMDRLIPDTEGYGIKKADVIIEAVDEELDIKKKLFQQFERQAKTSALLTTNTSSIRLEDIQQGMQHPERLLGLHFFNSVAKRPLVEIVSTALTPSMIAAQGINFIHQLHLLPLPVKNGPGYLINRVLMPYLLQAILLHEKSLPASVIDEAAIHFGMFTGPLELVDSMGLDVCLKVAKVLKNTFSFPIPKSLEKKVTQNHLGKKTGQGFYIYDPQKKIIKEKKAETFQVPVDLIDQLIHPMIEEAKKCLQQQIVEDCDLLDAGMIFGAGFPPFRGGLLWYAREKDINSESEV